MNKRELYDRLVENNIDCSRLTFREVSGGYELTVDSRSIRPTVLAAFVDAPNVRVRSPYVTRRNVR